MVKITVTSLSGKMGRRNDPALTQELDMNAMEIDYVGSLVRNIVFRFIWKEKFKILEKVNLRCSIVRFRLTMTEAITGFGFQDK
jgi:hypothetical protein